MCGQASGPRVEADFSRFSQSDLYPFPAPAAIWKLDLLRDRIPAVS
jgi:hypothetical protein